MEAFIDEVFQYSDETLETFPEKPEKKEAPERKEGVDSQNKKNNNPNSDYRYHKPKTTSSAVMPVPDAEGQSVSRFPETSSAVVLLSSLG